MDRLQRRINDAGLGEAVMLLGSLNQEQMNQMYAESDVFVLPSFGEGVPVVLMEAMSNEVPCISTYVNGVPELIEHKQSGLLVPPADVGALALAMECLAGDVELRDRLGRAGREKVQMCFDLDKNVQRLSGIFEMGLRS